MNQRILKSIAVAACVAVSAISLNAAAQGSSAYWTQPAGNNVAWKNATGLCWRAGYWSPAMATRECDADLLPKPAPIPAALVAPPPPAPQAPAPKPPPAAPKPVAQKVTFAADLLFDFDKSALKPEGRNKLDDLAQKAKAIDLEVVIAIGHTDSIGSDAYNQKLSMRRAESVKAYLVSKGVPTDRIYTEGKGEKQPVASNKTREGRASNRRVEIEVVGTRRN